MVLNPTRRRVTAAVLMSVALLGMAACGDDDETTSAGQSATTAPVVQTTAAAAATTTTASSGVLRTSTKDPFGMFLTDSTGKTLYTFDRDTSPTSACTGQCATTWPPLLLPAGASTSIPAPAGTTGALTVSARPDGSGSQVVWNGKPLYRYSGDVNPGDTTGDGVGGVWHIAKAS
jgi:predicted lipoprotein with Yx(FWY)xxD motif